MRIALVIAIAGAFLAQAGCQHVREDRIVHVVDARNAHPAIQMKPVPEGLGVNIHFYKGGEKDLSMIEASGIGIIRMDISWGHAEKEAGVYDFSNYDQLVRDMEARGIRILFIIDYGNELYDGGLAPQSEACRAASARFCEALAERYAAKDIIGELWNEPNLNIFWKPKPNVADYMAWCHAVVPAIRKAAPQACIISPAVSGVDRGFLRGCFERGLLELVDGVSVHPYRSYKSGPETALTQYALLREMIDTMKPANRGHIPIISGEWGYTTSELTPEQQGKFLVRQWLANMSAGVPISIWYDWHDDGEDPKEREHHFGTVAFDYTPKPAYTAMKTLIDHLDGFAPVGRLRLRSDTDFAVAFRKGSQWRIVLWTMRETHKTVLPRGLCLVDGVDWQGNPIQAGTGTAIRLTDAPGYYRIEEPIPGWLDGE